MLETSEKQVDITVKLRWLHSYGFRDVSDLSDIMVSIGLLPLLRGHSLPLVSVMVNLDCGHNQDRITWEGYL